MPAVETADVELASAVERKPADTAASLLDTVMQKVVVDIPNALKTVAEASVAAVLHVDTAAYKHHEVGGGGGGGGGAAAAAAAGIGGDGGGEGKSFCPSVVCAPVGNMPQWP